MAINNLTHQPILSISVNSAEDIPANRFVSYVGTKCSTETKSLGVSEIDIYTGVLSQVTVLGVMVIETSGSINIGDEVTADTDGKAKVAEAGMPINGRALTACSGAGFVRIILV